MSLPLAEIEDGGTVDDSDGNGSTWLLVTVLTTIYTCAFVDRAVLSLLVEPIERTLHVTDFEMSLLLGLGFSLFMAVLNIPAGIAADRYGRRGLIGAATLAWSAMTVLTGFAGSFWQLLVCRLGVGLAEAFVTPASFSLIRDRVALASRGRAFSLLGVAPSLGGAVAFIGGGALIAAHARGAFAAWPVLGGLFDWQAVLVAFGAIGALTVLLLLFLKRDVQRIAKPAEPMGAQLGAAWRHMRDERRYYGPLILYATAGSMLAFGYVGWFPTVIGRNFGMSAARIGAVTGPILLATSISGLMLCGPTLDWLAARGRNILGYGLFAMAAGVTSAALTGLMPTPTTMFAMLAVTVFFGSNFYPVAAALLARRTPARLMGSTTAIYLLCLNLIGAGLGPTLVALLSRGFDGPNAIGYGLTIYTCAAGTMGLLAGASLLLAMSHTAASVPAARLAEAQ